MVGFPFNLYLKIFVPPLAGMLIGGSGIVSTYIPAEPVPFNFISVGAGVKVSALLLLFTTAMLIVLVVSKAPPCLYVPFMMLSMQLRDNELTVTGSDCV